MVDLAGECWVEGEGLLPVSLRRYGGSGVFRRRSRVEKRVPRVCFTCMRAAERWKWPSSLGERLEKPACHFVWNVIPDNQMCSVNK